MKCVLVGTAYPYRGGLASFNERLAKEFIAHHHKFEIFTFILQYPNFLFPGKTQYSTSPAPHDLKIIRKVNSVNPVNWRKVGKEIKKLAPDLLIIKYWMPFMAPCFGTIAKIAKQNKKTKVICIADNIIPHERKFYDAVFTKYFVKQVDAFVVMSENVKTDLQKFTKNKPVAFNPHPLFDNFGEKISKEQACIKLNVDVNKKYVLFFGFIREYKGLDLLLKAFADERLKTQNLELIIAGEYYTVEKKYQDIIKELKLEDRIHQFNHFIADEDVKYYFCSADLVVQPYKHASQSGVTQIAYHFETPMIVTNVGGLAEIVPDKKVGYVVESNEKDIADAIIDFYEVNRKDYFKASIKEEKKRFGWDKMLHTIIEVSGK
ncbi:MAG: glycosyltransferase [Fimbriimonadaceae bacterium]|nr:glycosyltransferase [Chitinophagales bacterium]